MAMFMHVDGLRGINLELVTEWTYDEKKALNTRRGDTEVSESVLRVFFAAGHVAEFAGSQAAALHRHLMTKSRSLT